jgi:molybdopterin adenylyltransferase
MIGVLVVTISDSSVAGTREDRSGPAVAERVEQLGWTVVGRELVADDSEQIAELLKSACDRSRANVVLTTGGTGVAARDVTPEATRAVVEREIPGLPEVMRAEGRKHTYLAPLSRAVAGTRERTLIVNLPGSPKGAVESLDAIANLIPHIADLLEGRTEHSSARRNSKDRDHVQEKRL